MFQLLERAPDDDRAHVTKLLQPSLAGVKFTILVLRSPIAKAHGSNRSPFVLCMVIETIRGIVVGIS